MAARIFRTVADADINIDMVLQNISRTGETFTDITFTLPKVDGPRAVTALTGVQREIGFAEIVHDDEVGKVSLIGAGMRNHPGVTATFCEALSQAGINIETMNTSEIRISVICRVDQLDTAVGALHSAFELGGDERAVVHAGTGR
jgi:aspartate kinase